MESIKYYETQEPYHAIIAAISFDEAIKFYTEIVADDDDGELSENMSEIDRDCALIACARCHDMETNKPLSINAIKKIIDSCGVLVMEEP